MKLYGNLQKQPLPVAHSMYLLHAVKNSQRQFCSSFDMIFSGGIALCNVMRCHQNIIFKIVHTLDEILLFPKIIGDSVQKGNTGHPKGFCIEQVNKVLADDHGRHDQSRIFLINVHLLRQCLLSFVNRLFIAV